jgi:hypothetical protein
MVVATCPSPEPAVVMSVLRVICESCGRGWYVGGNVSVYFQLELVSNPCPYCEAYALSCADVSGRRQARRRLPPPGDGEGRRPNRAAAVDGSG